MAYGGNVCGLGGISRSSKIAFNLVKCSDISRFLNDSFAVGSWEYDVQYCFNFYSPFCENFFNFYGVSFDDVSFINYAIKPCFFDYSEVERYCSDVLNLNTNFSSFITTSFYPPGGGSNIYHYLLNSYHYFGRYDNDGFFPKNGYPYNVAFYCKKFVKRLYLLDYPIVTFDGYKFCFGVDKSLIALRSFFRIKNDYTFDVYIDNVFLGNYSHDDFISYLSDNNLYAIGAIKENGAVFIGNGYIYLPVYNNCVCRNLENMNKTLRSLL